MQNQEPAVMCVLDHKSHPYSCNGKCWSCQHNIDYPVAHKYPPKQNGK